MKWLTHGTYERDNREVVIVPEADFGHAPCLQPEYQGCQGHEQGDGDGGINVWLKISHT